VITCACGNTFVTGSTKKEIHTDVCSNCHPFFTGEQRIVDTAGQVERFMKRAGQKEKIAAAHPVPEEKPVKKEKGRDQKIAPKPVVVTPAELPLAVMEEKPGMSEPPVTAQPAMEVPQPEPVAEVKPIVFAPEPVAPVRPMPAPAPMREPEPTVMEPIAAKPRIAKSPKTRIAKGAKVTKAAAARKPAAKKAAPKKAAPKAKVAAKPKASAAKKPAAKKPAAKKKK